MPLQPASGSWFGNGGDHRSRLSGKTLNLPQSRQRLSEGRGKRLNRLRPATTKTRADNDLPEVIAAKVFEAECDAFPEAINLIGAKDVDYFWQRFAQANVKEVWGAGGHKR